MHGLLSLLTLHRKLTCLNCQTGDGIVAVRIPYVFRYLTLELLAANVKIAFNVDSVMPLRTVKSCSTASYSS